MSRFCHATAGRTIAAAASDNPPGVYVTIDGHTAFVHVVGDRIVASAEPPGHFPSWGDAEAAQVAHRSDIGIPITETRP